MVKAKKAIFFDRDGTLIKTKISNDNKPLAIKKLNECIIFPSVKKILNKLKKNFLIFVITNQPDVANKKNLKLNVIRVNNHLKKILPIKEFFVCYCNNDKCKFRKPNIGMILKAKKKYNLDLENSYVIGDRWKDVDAGNKAGCITILLDKQYNEKLNTIPDYTINYFYNLQKLFKI